MFTETALCAASAIATISGSAPEWLHLLPKGEIRTRDGRGPYRVNDPALLAAQSLAEAGGKMVLCDNHATDLAAPEGRPAPARGWIVDLQTRSDGIWGRINWTAEGRRLVEAGEYRGVSPVISHTSDGTITGLLRASLVNQPNFIGLTSLHSASDAPYKMDKIDRFIQAQMGFSKEKFIELVTGSAGFKADVERLRQFYQKHGLPDEKPRSSGFFS